MAPAKLISCIVLVLSVPAQAPIEPDACPAADMRLCQDRERGRKIKALDARSGDPVARLSLLAERRQYHEALRVLDVIVDEAPAQIGPALEAFAPLFAHSISDGVFGNQDGLAAILERAGRRLPEIPDGARADAALRLLRAQSSARLIARGDWPARLSRFADEYRGTAAAASARIGLLYSHGDVNARIEALEHFAREHPRSAAGAHALFQAAGLLAQNAGARGRHGAGDLIARFEHVQEIAERLESGAWPDSEWVRRAPELLAGFSWSREELSPGSVDVLLTAYRDFVSRHLASGNSVLRADRIAHVIQSKFRQLYEFKGISLSEIDRLFDEWARVAEPEAVRYLQGVTFEHWMRDTPGQRETWRDRAREAFASLAGAGRGAYHRLALASLASLHFRDRDFSTAAGLYARYLAEYPQSPYAWAAALRLGQAHEETKNWAAAAAAYDRAADDYAGEPLAQVFGRANAGRAREALGPAYVLHTSFNDGWPGRVTLKSAEPLTKASLAEDAARLERAIAMPGGLLLERGRARLAEGRWVEAESALSAFLESHPASDATGEARYMRHLAQLNRALDLADVENASPDAGGARRILDAIAGAPWDPAVGLARVAGASLSIASDPAAARRAMRAALEEWQRLQQAPPGAPALDGLMEDVAELRKAVFRPAGGEPYTRERRFEAFPPSTPRPFLVVSPDVIVGLADGTERDVAAFRAARDVVNVVFLTREHRDLLARIAEALGGTRTRQPEAVMEVPNQPVGNARALVSLWNEFFEAQPGHWQGWMFETAPIVNRIDFLNPERTKAAVRVTMRYEGVTVMLEKDGAVWKVVRLANRWIT
jgi:TolA-binding protein